MSAAAAGDLVAAFAAEAERSGSVVHRCDGVEPVAALVASLAAGGRVGLAPSLAARHPELAAALERQCDAFQPGGAAEAAEAAVGVSAGDALVAETGSVLVSEHDVADRAVSMLSPTLVQVASEGSAVAGLDDVAALLTAAAGGGVPGYQALVTGPSRSADIERSLTIGVQGPAELHVAILIDGERS